MELIALLLAIAFVLITEMLNTAVEAAVNVATTSFDPMAKLAKDIAAGAVLISTAVAVAVGYLVCSGRVATAAQAARPAHEHPRRAGPDRARSDVDHHQFGRRLARGRGFATPAASIRHAAIAFSLDSSHLILDDSRNHFLISSLTFIMALLVAQTRVESGVHSSLEVAYGGILGALVTLVVFQVAQ